MTRVLLASADTISPTQLQIPKPTYSYPAPSSQMNQSSNGNVEVLQGSLAQMTTTTVAIPVPNSRQISVPIPHSSDPHLQQQNNSSSGCSGQNAITNGGVGHQQQNQTIPTSSLMTQQSLELHPSFVNTLNTLNMMGETDVRPHMCQICSASYKTRTHLRRHMFIHLTSRPYPCPDCGKGFNRREHLNKHTEAVHSGTKYKCPYCGKEISRKDHLSRHIKNMHLSTSGDHVQLRNITEGSSQPQNLKSLSHSNNKHTSLPRVFPSGLSITNLHHQSSARLHNSSHARYFGGSSNNKSDVLLSYNGSAQNVSTTDKNIQLQLYNCPECSATFTSDRDLSIHSRIHKPQPYKCNECTRAYTRREKLTEHVRCFHQGQKFSCEFCGKELSRKDHVLRHVRSVHPEVLANRFVAINDSGSFSAANSQMRSPNSAAPLHGNNSSNIPLIGEMGVLLRSVCQLCMKVFGTSYHLCRHMESCHNGDVRPYSCTHCSKQFKRKDHLTKHSKSHCPSLRDTSGLRAIIRGSGPNGETSVGSNGVIQNSSLNSLENKMHQDALEALQQDAIESLQIEMMTDAENESDSSDEDNDEDSKELPGLVENLQTNNSTNRNSIKKGGITKLKSGAPTPAESDFALSILKASLMGGEEGNENSLAHLQMDTSGAEHIRILQPTFPCGHCQKEFNSRSRLIQHLQEHPNIGLKGVQQSNSLEKGSSETKDTERPVVQQSSSGSELNIPIPSMWTT